MLNRNNTSDHNRFSTNDTKRILDLIWCLNQITRNTNGSMTLLAILEVFANANTGKNTDSLTLSVRYLSSRTGVPKSTTQECIKNLSSKGLISRSGKLIEVHLDKLLESAASSTYPKQTAKILMNELGHFRQ